MYNFSLQSCVKRRIFLARPGGALNAVCEEPFFATFRAIDNSQYGVTEVGRNV